MDNIFQNKDNIFDLKEKLEKLEELNQIECLHKNCKNCNGTGVNKLKQICIHMISCPCSRCSPKYL